MEIKSISSISGKLFKTNSNKIEKCENRSSHTNPFGVSFKGNIINADVFEENSGLTERQNRGKMLVSTLVGSINSINSSISKRLNSVVNFGRRVGETTANLWNHACKTDMTTFMGNISDKISLGGTYSVNKLQKRPVSELKALLTDKITAMEA